MTEATPTLIHTHVREDGSATVLCPACKRRKIVNVSQLSGKHRIKAKCPCGLIFEVVFDYRRAYRKPIHLTGSYTLLPPARGEGLLRITNISRGGVRLELSPRHGVTVGQSMEIGFQLDDKRRSEIQRQVTVRHVQGEVLGCEFIEHDFFDKVLGFYLNP